MKEDKLLGVLENMHLQWFADAEVEIESEEEEPEVEFLVEGRDEIPDEEPKEDGPSKEALMAELESLRQQQSLVSEQLGDRKTLEEGFSKLSQALVEQRENGNVAAENMPSWEELKKKLSKNFYDDPMTAVEETLKYFVQSEIAPAFKQTQDMLSKTAISTSRQLAVANPTNKMIMDKFGDEVEETVKKLPHTPDVYEKACQQVGMNHFTDIVQFQVQEAMSNAGNNNAVNSKPTSNVLPSGIVSQGKTSNNKVRRILTKDQKEWADRKGVTYEDAWAVFNNK